MNTRLEDLCNRMLDGALDDAGEQELLDLLQSDPDARRRMRNYAALQAILRREYTGLAARGGAATAVPSRGRSWWLLATAAAALVALTVLVGRTWWSTPREAMILTVVDLVGGDLIWSTAATTRRNLAIGDTVSAGHLVCEGEGASASVRFADGTRLTLDGGTELSLDERGQKQVHLMRGLFSAEVRPQPAGRPMIIRTATAELQVLGTVFSVAAQPATTALDVASGRVRMQRLADGQTVEVAGRQHAVATLDASTRLDTALRQRPPTTYRNRFDQAPPDWCRGRWQAADAQSDGTVAAAPLTAGRRPSGEPVIVHGLTMRSVVTRTTPLVHALAESRLYLRFRTDPAHRDTTLVVFFSTLTTDGDFGGNFQTRIEVAETRLDADGWRSVELPLSACEALMPTRHPRFAERDVFLIMPYAFSSDAGLVVDELAILP